MNFLKAVLALYYIVEVMLLEEKESHEGPFVDNDKWVGMPNGKFQRLSLFDRIRGFFGVYRKDGDIWYVNPGWKTELWTCPICLSMWGAFLFSIPYFFQSKFNFIKTYTFHFALSGASSLIFMFLNYLNRPIEPLILFEEAVNDEDDDEDI